MKSVYIEQFTPDLNNLTLVWDEIPTKNDIIHAFVDLRVALNALDVPQNVIVVLNGHVRFPLLVTTTNALPVHKHPNLKAWLVVSKDNSVARTIANVLSMMGQDKKVMWFKSKDDVTQYLLNQDHSVIADILTE